MRIQRLAHGNSSQYRAFIRYCRNVSVLSRALPAVLTDVCIWFISIGAFCMPLYIPYALTGTWHLGRGLCKIWLVMDYLLCTASVFNIVLISYDRFLSVTKAVSTLFIASLILLQDHWRIIFTNLCHVGEYKPKFNCNNSPQKCVSMWRLLDICS